MKDPRTTLYKLADKIRCQCVYAARQPLFDLAAMEQSQRDLTTLHHRMLICQDKGWLAALKVGIGQLPRTLREIGYALKDLEDATNRAQQVNVSSVQDVLADLAAMQAEFGDYAFDAKKRTISVLTDAIELDDVYLGEFRIVLHIDGIGADRHPYDVVADDPHCAATNDSVTHPHVQDETLCEGDASAAIRAALASGRILDFFVLVRSVLRTYNAHSPYVKLEDWQGESRHCDDCGCSIDDDSYSCDQCDSQLCSDCSRYCDQCDRSYCGQCARLCHECESSGCPSCADKCASCHKTTCKECSETCQVCSETTCNSCMAECEHCRETMCQDCADNCECAKDETDETQTEISANETH